MSSTVELPITYFIAEKGIGCPNCHWTGCVECRPSVIKSRHIEAMNAEIIETAIVKALQDNVKALQDTVKELQDTIKALQDTVKALKCST